MKKILLIGAGYHSRRIYLPYFKKHADRSQADIVAILDIESQKEVIKAYLEKQELEIPMYFLDNNIMNQEDYYTAVLDKIKREKEIDSVIISTEPISHLRYAKWALESQLNILMDKPISSYEGVSTDTALAKRILEDYIELNQLYQKQKQDNPNLIFELMAQRRYHPAYYKMKELLQEIYELTNCPITSIQSSHSDGQWRFPSEIVHQFAHPYSQGYGKVSHSGYHTIDMVCHLMEIYHKKTNPIDNINIYASAIRPLDFLNQLELTDYEKLFPDFNQYNQYKDQDYDNIMRKFGEIDCFVNLEFKHKSDTMALGSLNLIHNGFSQRNWVTSIGRDLYKGNGRVRHEQYYIEQGPFQAISFISYQSKEIRKDEQSLYDVGGEYHLDIHVFRNNTLFPNLKAYEKIEIRDIFTPQMEDYSRGHQEDARLKGIEIFIDAILNGYTKSTEDNSNISKHFNSVSIMSGIYQSLAGKFLNQNQVINLPFYVRSNI
jgi:Oxidoreductase family, NAD-binding Rossmann fold